MALNLLFLEGDDNLYKVIYPKDIAIIEEIYKLHNLKDNESK